MGNPTRTEWLKLRVTPGEKALVEERATAAGLPVSEFLRRLGMTGQAGKSAPSAAEPRTPSAAQGEDEFKARLARAKLRLPTGAAENQVRREMAAEAARAALAAR